MNMVKINYKGRAGNRAALEIATTRVTTTAYKIITAASSPQPPEFTGPVSIHGIYTWPRRANDISFRDQEGWRKIDDK
jgi:hypothetical protein